MKPVLLYVDDEPMNLTVLEAALPSDWTIHTFDSPLKALDQISLLNPWVVLSDQKMPGMNGVSFLEIVKKTNPHAIRVLVTGYSDEDLVIDSVRKAQISDYIRKPWDVEELEHRIEKLVQTYILEKENREKTAQLEVANIELKKALDIASTLRESEERLRKELECWAPPFIKTVLNHGDANYPLKKDLALITYDIIKSSELHGKYYEGIPIRALILRGFTEILLKVGAWRESHSGDSAFGHIGLYKEVDNSCDLLYSVASSFKIFLRDLSIKSGVPFECGIGLHYATGIVVDLHVVKIDAVGGSVVQKSFDTTGTGVDLVHRIEKFTHEFPGTNVAMTRDFTDRLKNKPVGLVEFGSFLFKGQPAEVEVIIKPSDKSADYIREQAQGKVSDKAG